MKKLEIEIPAPLAPGYAMMPKKTFGVRSLIGNCYHRELTDAKMLKASNNMLSVNGRNHKTREDINSIISNYRFVGGDFPHMEVAWERKRRGYRKVPKINNPVNVLVGFLPKPDGEMEVSMGGKDLDVFYADEIDENVECGLLATNRPLFYKGCHYVNYIGGDGIVLPFGTFSQVSHTMHPMSMKSRSFVPTHSLTGFAEVLSQCDMREISLVAEVSSIKGLSTASGDKESLLESMRIFYYDTINGKEDIHRPSMVNMAHTASRFVEKESRELLQKSRVCALNNGIILDHGEIGGVPIIKTAIGTLTRCSRSVSSILPMSCSKVAGDGSVFTTPCLAGNNIDVNLVGSFISLAEIGPNSTRVTGEGISTSMHRFDKDNIKTAQSMDAASRIYSGSSKESRTDSALNQLYSEVLVGFGKDSVRYRYNRVKKVAIEGPENMGMVFSSNLSPTYGTGKNKDLAQTTGISLYGQMGGMICSSVIGMVGASANKNKLSNPFYFSDCAVKADDFSFRFVSVAKKCVMHVTGTVMLPVFYGLSMDREWSIDMCKPVILDTLLMEGQGIIISPSGKVLVKRGEEVLFKIDIMNCVAELVRSLGLSLPEKMSVSDLLCFVLSSGIAKACVDYAQGNTSVSNMLKLQYLAVGIQVFSAILSDIGRNFEMNTDSWIGTARDEKEWKKPSKKKNKVGEGWCALPSRTACAVKKDDGTYAGELLVQVKAGKSNTTYRVSVVDADTGEEIAQISGWSKMEFAKNRVFLSILRGTLRPMRMPMVYTTTTYLQTRRWKKLSSECMQRILEELDSGSPCMSEYTVLRGALDKLRKEGKEDMWNSLGLSIGNDKPSVEHILSMADRTSPMCKHMIDALSVKAGRKITIVDIEDVVCRTTGSELLLDTWAVDSPLNQKEIEDLAVSGVMSYGMSFGNADIAMVCSCGGNYLPAIGVGVIHSQVAISSTQRHSVTLPDGIEYTTGPDFPSSSRYVKRHPIKTLPGENSNHPESNELENVYVIRDIAINKTVDSAEVGKKTIDGRLAAPAIAGALKYDNMHINRLGLRDIHLPIPSIEINGSKILLLNCATPSGTGANSNGSANILVDRRRIEKGIVRDIWMGHQRDVVNGEILYGQFYMPMVPDGCKGGDGLKESVVAINKAAMDSGCRLPLYVSNFMSDPVAYVSLVRACGNIWACYMEYIEAKTKTKLLRALYDLGTL